MIFQGFGDVTGKGIPIHRQRPARGHPGLIRRRQHQGIHAAHFFLQQAHGVLHAV